MGNDCDCIKKKAKLNDELMSENGTLTKICGEKELKFWNELLKLGFVQISNVNKKSVVFAFSDFIFENYVSISQIMEYLITEQNFLYFITLYEITIAIVDFIQIIFMLKNKYGINTTDFFFINFEKFYLMKKRTCETDNYSKLVYIDEKINDNYAFAEILFKEEVNNMLSSFNMSDHTSNNTQMMRTLLKDINLSNSNNFRSTFSINVNSYFYSNCNERFQNLKSNYSLAACEKFYAENIMNFFTRFLLKKVVIQNSDLEHHFSNFKVLIRHTISGFFKTEDKFTLQNVKMLLTNFYLNNYEFSIFKDNFAQKFLNSDSSIFLEKVLSYKNSGISLIYGECDVVTDCITEHKIVFLYDYLKMNNDNINGVTTPYICINCANNVIVKKTPDSDSISLKRLEEEIIKKHSFVDLVYFLKYLCSYFENDEKTNKLLTEMGGEIQVYKKNKFYLTFECTNWDDDDDQQNHNKILNLDIISKNTIKKRNFVNNNERISLFPNITMK